MAKKIKITYIVPNLNIGGAERFLLDLIHNLNKEEFDISVILFQSEGALVPELKAESIKYFILEKKHRIDWSNLTQIYKILKEVKPDIVHTQLGGDVRGRIAALLASVRCIISTEQNVNKEEGIIYSLLKSFITLLTTEVISISRAVQRASKKKYILSAHKYKRIIYNGVDINRFIYLKHKAIDYNHIIVGAASRLVPQKGLEILINAWNEIKPKNAQLIIGGNGPLRDKLTKLISRHQLESSVKLIGWPPSMPNFYHEIDIFIMPSRWEGLGIAALEAAASGTPMILSDADGLQEIAKTDEAWIAQANNLNSLTQSLKTALVEIREDTTEIKRKKMREKIEKLFANEIIAHQYSNLYKSLIK